MVKLKEKSNGKLVWHSEKRKISQLNPAKYNPRELTEKQMQDLAISLDKFSLADPIVINYNNTIIGGHQRINILKTKGVGEVDVRIPNRLLTQDEEVELNLRLNKNLGQWDFDALANFDEAVLKDVGFESKELDHIFQLDVKPEDDDVPEIRTTDIKLGDMFKLGEHVLLCGDCTAEANVARLMGQDKADMVFTDPPYNLKDIRGAGIFKESVMKVADNIKDIAQFDPTAFLFILPLYFINSMNAYIFCNKDLIPEYLNYARSSRYDFDILTWHKTSHIPLGGCHHYPDTEYIIYLRKNPIFHRGLSAEHYRKYFNLAKEKVEGHPTAKPIEIISLEIELSSNREGIVVDPFGGSGSTLIACEKTNRKCRMMEIDPIYCQVILDRWEKFTNKKVVKLNGKTRQR